MSLMSFLVLLLVAGICGSIGQAIAGYSRGGCLASIALGFIGALLGRYIASVLATHAPALREPFPVTIGNESFPIVWSIIGATLFVLVISLITRRRLR